MKKRFYPPSEMLPCIVQWLDPDSRPRAETLAERLRLTLYGSDAPPDCLALQVTPVALRLKDLRPGAPGAIQVDLTERGSHGRLERAGGQSELLGRAVGARHGRRPSVVDATAGLGGDSAVLAAVGCRVIMVERHPVIAALLRDGLERATITASTDSPRLLEADAEDWLRKQPEPDRPDVVYLDPMYPDTGRRTRARKEMQLLQALLGDQSEPVSLLETALTVARHRVVVKRPRKAGALGGREPHHTIAGKSTRFDVYMTP